MFNYIIRVFSYRLTHMDELSVHTEHEIGLRTPVWVTEAQNRVKRRTCQVQRRTWLFRRHKNFTAEAHVTAQRRTWLHRGARLCIEAPHLSWWGARLCERRREVPVSVAIRRTPVRAGTRLCSPETHPRRKNFKKTVINSNFSFQNLNQQIYSL